MKSELDGSAGPDISKNNLWEKQEGTLQETYVYVCVHAHAWRKRDDDIEWWVPYQESEVSTIVQIKCQKVNLDYYNYYSLRPTIDCPLTRNVPILQ